MIFSPPHLFRVVPDLYLPQEALRAGGQLQVELQPEGAVHVVEEVQATVDLALDLEKKNNKRTTS